MKSHRQIFRSSAIIGGSSVINIAIGIIKVKVLAVLLGPAGIGLMGVYQNIMGVASTIAGCGLATSGVRQLAASSGEEATLSIVRRTLWLANLMLGLTGMVVLWLFREQVAELVFGDVAHVVDVGWLGVGVFFALIASSQTALLQGLRRIGDLARINVYSAIIGACVGIAAVYLVGKDGVIWFVVTAPATSAVVAMYYASKLPKVKTPRDWQAIQQQCQIMMKIGLPFMAAGLLTLLTLLVARSMVLNELGLNASGYFQAAWAISMTYVGFVLGAMGADYYPRLSAVITDHPRASQLVNEQAEMTLLMAGPVLLAMLVLAPWVIHLLYAASFAPATELLRWQVLGDIAKVVSWSMGFILLAQGRSGLFFATQFIWSAIYLAVIVLGISQWGLLITGFGFFVAYIVLLCVNIFVAKKLVGFVLTPRNLLLTLALLLSAGGIMWLSNVSTVGTHVVGTLIILIFSVYSLRRLNLLLDLSALLRKKFGKIK